MVSNTNNRDSLQSEAVAPPRRMRLPRFSVAALAGTTIGLSGVLGSAMYHGGERPILSDEPPVPEEPVIEGVTSMTSIESLEEFNAQLPDGVEIVLPSRHFAIRRPDYGDPVADAFFFREGNFYPEENFHFDLATRTQPKIGISCLQGADVKVVLGDTVAGIGLDHFPGELARENSQPLLEEAMVQLNIDRGNIEDREALIHPGDTVATISECVVSTHWQNQDGDSQQVSQHLLSSEIGDTIAYWNRDEEGILLRTS